jgi:hypothetical protein
MLQTYVGIERAGIKEDDPGKHRDRERLARSVHGPRYAERVLGQRLGGGQEVHPAVDPADVVFDGLSAMRPQALEVCPEVPGSQAHQLAAQRQLRPGQEGMVLDQRDDLGLVSCHRPVWGEDPGHRDPSPREQYQEPGEHDHDQEGEGQKVELPGADQSAGQVGRGG